MELTVKKGDLMPLRTLPSEVLKGKIIEDLMPWITQLLSIKPTDENVLKLEALFPIIEQTAWSMNFREIKQAFLKYVKGELAGLEPRDNYLTPILFGQVIRAYKEQRKPEAKALPEPTTTEEEKKLIVLSGIVNCFDEWNQTDHIIPGYTWVYDHLDELGLINYTTKQKKAEMRRAKGVLNAEALRDPKNKKSLQDEIEKKNSPKVILEAKRRLLGQYFQKIKREGKHIKELI